MPIKPENKNRYPPDWPEISKRIRFDRAEGRCECTGECGHEHDGRCTAMHGEPHPVTGSIVILTTAHLDDTPENCEDENLKGMCQRCHLAFDRDIHRRNRHETMMKRKAAGDLFDGAYDDGEA